MRLSLAAYWESCSPADVAARAQAVEAAGFDAVWCGEIDGTSDPFVMLATIAAHTRRLTVGTSVASWTRAPITMASSAATLDRVSGGRAILGLGVGPLDRSAPWFGIPTDRVLRRLRSYVGAVRHCWAAAPGCPSYVDDDFPIAGYARAFPPLRTTIPLYLAAVQPGMARLAGAIADGVILHYLHSLPYLEAVIVPAIAAGAASVGRPVPAIVPSVLVCPGADGLERARARIVRYAAHPYVAPLFAFHGAADARATILDRLSHGDAQRAEAAVPELFARAVALVGDWSAIRRQLAGFAPFSDMVRLHLVGDTDTTDFDRLYTSAFAALA